jgi:DNA-binding NarL/FixJ family response regulator
LGAAPASGANVTVAANASIGPRAKAAERERVQGLRVVLVMPSKLVATGVDAHGQNYPDETEIHAYPAAFLGFLPFDQAPGTRRGRCWFLFLWGFVAPEKSSSRPAARIVLVEDQTIFRELLAALLTSDGRYEVAAEVAQGAEVLAVCQRVLPDLVILDAVLPDQSGLDVLVQLMAWQSRLKVLMVTGHARPPLVQQAISAGARGFVTKATPLAELRQAVDRVLLGQRYLCSETGTLLADAVQLGSGNAELTDRQKEIVRFVAQGMSSKQIGQALGIAEKTVNNHRLQIRERLQLHDVASLTRYAIEQGFIEPKA